MKNGNATTGMAANDLTIVEKAGLFHVIGPDGQDYGRRATREYAEGLLAWVEQNRPRPTN